MITPEEKERIAQELSRKFGARDVKCPMCGNNHFIIADGYFNTFMQNDLKQTNLGGPSIPSIPIICDNCGFISMHALGILGLLPQKGPTEKGGEYGK